MGGKAHKRGHHDDLLKLAWLQQFMRGRPWASITRNEIAAIGQAKRTRASGATANRFLALIRSILRRACYEWEWIDKVPKLQRQRDLALFALATGRGNQEFPVA